MRKDRSGPVVGGCGRGPGSQAVRPFSRTRQCPVSGCGDVIDQSRLMCRRDWYAVPKPVRDLVWATWRSGSGALADDHLRAIRLAIAVSVAARGRRRAQPGTGVSPFSGEPGRNPAGPG